jgi:hypothetical protein
VWSPGIRTARLNRILAALLREVIQACPPHEFDDGAACMRRPRRHRSWIALFLASANVVVQQLLHAHSGRCQYPGWLGSPPRSPAKAASA